MMIRSTAVLALAAALAIPAVGPAFAQHGHDRYDDHRGERRYYHDNGNRHDYHHDNGYRDNSGAIIGGALLGLGVGALVGGAIAPARPPAYYVPPPAYYAPPPPVYYAPPPRAYYAPPPPAVYYGY
jgi:hypothetical protein